MSLIERVAELLGPVALPNATASAREAGAVERAAKIGQARPAKAGGPTLNIDLDRLRSLGIVTPDGERTELAESFRRIKRPILSNVANPRAGTPTNLITLTSTVPGEGKTFCAINLAISIASEMDRTVLLVDADVARPSVSKALGVEMGRGLLDVLLDRRLDLSAVLCKTNIEKLSILPAGTSHPHANELIASAAMNELLHEMASRYNDRIIIFDSPPLLAASEASVLVNQMGQIVVVVEAGKTSEAAIKSAMDRIETSRVAGFVLNKWEGPSLGYYYGYGGYGYSK
jgi:protein-tyrosine kinase